MDLVLKHWIDQPNAGDIFSRDVAEKYIGPVSAVAEQNPTGSANLLLIGSLMPWIDSETYVCGTGMLSPESLPKMAPKEFVSVRGPLARYYLIKSGFDVPERYGDTGILAGDFIDDRSKPDHRIGVILHHSERWMEKKLFRRKNGFKKDILFPDVTAHPLNLIKQIARCEMIFSSSLHGIIFANALNIPAAWLALTDRVCGKGFKYYDYYLSLGVSPDQVPLLHRHEVTNLYNYEHLPQIHDTSNLIGQARESLSIVRDRFNIKAN